MQYTGFTDVTVSGSITTGTVSATSASITAITSDEATIKRITSLVTVLSKAADYALTAAEKTGIVTITMGANAGKVLTLGLANGQLMIVKHAGAGGTQNILIKNIAADTGTALVPTKSILCIGAAGTNGMILITLD